MCDPPWEVIQPAVEVCVPGGELEERFSQGSFEDYSSEILASRNWKQKNNGRLTPSECLTLKNPSPVLKLGPQSQDPKIQNQEEKEPGTFYQLSNVIFIKAILLNDQGHSYRAEVSNNLLN